MLNRIRSVLLGGGLLAMILAGSGCRQADLTRQHMFRPSRAAPVEFEGPAREQTPTAITVRNERGSVWIEVDERLSEPVVEAKLSWERNDKTRKAWPGTSGGAQVRVTRDTTQGPGTSCGSRGL